MVPDLSDLPLALLKQYYQGKDRWHSAALTNVSDWTPHLDQLVPTERRGLPSAKASMVNELQLGFLLGLTQQK